MGRIIQEKNFVVVARVNVANKTMMDVGMQS